MFATIILICLQGTDPAACTIASAIHRIDGPAADNELACMRQSQMFIAPLALVHHGDVVKVLCRRKRAFAGRGPDAAPDLR